MQLKIRVNSLQIARENLFPNFTIAMRIYPLHSPRSTSFLSENNSFSRFHLFPVAYAVFLYLFIRKIFYWIENMSRHCIHQYGVGPTHGSRLKLGSHGYYVWSLVFKRIVSIVTIILTIGNMKRPQNLKVHTPLTVLRKRCSVLKLILGQNCVRIGIQRALCWVLLGGLWHSETMCGRRRSQNVAVECTHSKSGQGRSPTELSSGCATTGDLWASQGGWETVPVPQQQPQISLRCKRTK